MYLPDIADVLKYIVYKHVRLAKNPTHDERQCSMAAKIGKYMPPTSQRREQLSILSHPVVTQRYGCSHITVSHGTLIHQVYHLGHAVWGRGGSGVNDYYSQFYRQSQFG